jgi:hypothetical protein
VNSAAFVPRFSAFDYASMRAADCAGGAISLSCGVSIESLRHGPDTNRSQTDSGRPHLQAKTALSKAAMHRRASLRSCQLDFAQPEVRSLPRDCRCEKFQMFFHLRYAIGERAAPGNLSDYAGTHQNCPIVVARMQFRPSNSESVSGPTQPCSTMSTGVLSVAAK